MANLGFKILNKDNNEPVEILIYDQIGTDFFSNDGITAKEFNEQLAKIPQDKQIKVSINSPGGNVWDGMAIYNALNRRKKNVVCAVDGVCASIATVIAVAGRELQVPKNAMLMIHRTWGLCQGNANEMQKMSESLEKHDKMIADIFRQKTGRSETEIMQKMTEETWFSGEDAINFGLADRLIEQPVQSYNLKNLWKIPESFLNKLKPNKGDEQMSEQTTNKTMETISEIKQSEVKVKNETQDDLIEMKKSVLELKNKLEQERIDRIKNQINEFVVQGRIEPETVENWTKLAIQNEAVIEQLKNIKPRPNPTEPILPFDAVTPDVREIVNQTKRLSGKFKTQFIIKNRDRLLPILNANTIDAGITRDVILTEAMLGFKRALAPINAFATVFRDVPLEGTNKIDVPYYGISSTASTDYSEANGYVATDSTVSSKSVTVSNRKYQALHISSYERNRTPYFNIQNTITMAAEKLAYDVMTSILGLVTNSNYGAAVVTQDSVDFDYDSLITIKTACDTANIPQVQRSLILYSTYYNILLSDERIGWAMSYGSAMPAQEGRIPVALGFQMYGVPTIPANSEKLKGFACYPYAVLIAFSPITPAQEVRQTLFSYQTVTDPDSGLTLEYRAWGSPDKDLTKEVIEVNYGFGVGETAGLKRIVSVN